ncbi:hypothetical protein PAPHI01_1288 [Pancytospora philotis]|nr:hypothetical protein PAPHI01_1288 [Pancytospora philotis]
MEEGLKAQYAEYTQLAGSTQDRLQRLGYGSAGEAAEQEIASFDDFRAAVGSLERAEPATRAMGKEELRESLKRCYKTYLKRSDIVQLLKNGAGGFSAEEIEEAFRILPVDVERGTLTDDLVEFLYQ